MTLIGKVLANRYEIIEEVGSGGMAVVYKAKCKLLNRFVAVKVLRPDLQNDDEFVRRFNVEAQAAASLTHPNIVSIFDVGNEDGLHYIVMEYIEGITLKEYIDEKHVLPWREAVGYAIQIARGLQQAHSNSIIHRDIKPHNIIMKNDGVLKVTDFGIARANVQSTMTCEDTAIGSVHYISPEQARGGYTDERSDIYSLGVVLYEMLTGTVPFESERPVTVAIMHLQDKPVPPREHNISIPLPLEKIVLKAMVKEVSGRYKNAGEMIDELEAVLNDPSREIVAEDIKDDAPDTDNDSTRIMPAVKLDIPKTEPETDEKLAVEEEVLEELKNKKKPAKSTSVEIDKKKERKVIATAIICAVLVIGVIAAVLFPISGIGDMLSGSKNIEIPEITGMLYEEALEKYVDVENEDAEYRVSIVKSKTVASDKEEGTIIEQNPEGGSKVKLQDEIVITVVLSEGRQEVTMKNYENKDYTEAELEVIEMGLRAEKTEEESDTVPTGVIISQSHPDGTVVKKGTTITFTVSKGPKEEEEPDKTNDKKPDEVTPNTGSEPDNKQPEVQKKSKWLTINGPSDKESAEVKVVVNGKAIYTETLKKGQYDEVKVIGNAGSSVEAKIYYDGAFYNSHTINFN